MNKINWLVAAVFGVVILLAFLVGASLLGGAWGMMGPGMMGGWGGGSNVWIGMILVGLIPVSFIVLIVLGVIWMIFYRPYEASSAITPRPSSEQHTE